MNSNNSLYISLFNKHLYTFVGPQCDAGFRRRVFGLSRKHLPAARDHGEDGDGFCHGEVLADANPVAAAEWEESVTGKWKPFELRPAFGSELKR